MKVNINLDNIWEQRSPEVKNLLHNMLERDFSKRYSASDCLNHQWIKSQNNFNREKELNTATLKAMANFQVG